jgi:hypothetical protein
MLDIIFFLQYIYWTHAFAGKFTDVVRENGNQLHTWRINAEA